MIPIMCIVQEGQVSKATETAFKSELDAFTRLAFAAQADIDWIVVKKGSGFTAALPSTTVIASMYANRPLKEPERISLLKELGDICMEETGRSANEVVTSIRNPKE